MTPQPVDPHRMTHVLAEFLPTDHPGMGNLCPVLFDIQWYRPSGLYREYRAAVYKPSPSTRPELLDDLFPRCFPDGDLLCSIWARGLPCVEGHVAALHRGDFVQLRLICRPGRKLFPEEEFRVQRNSTTMAFRLPTGVRRVKYHFISSLSMVLTTPHQSDLFTSTL